jgi:hypothetical protein
VRCPDDERRAEPESPEELFRPHNFSSAPLFPSLISIQQTNPATKERISESVSRECINARGGVCILVWVHKRDERDFWIRKR